MIKNNISSSVNRFAFDMTGFSQLKRQATNGTPEGIKQVAQQFETLFINLMMQSMRKAIPEGGLFNSSTSQMFTAMFDQQIAQQAAGKGFGLADMLTKQLSTTPSTTVKDPLVTTNNLTSAQHSLAQSLFTNSSTLSPKALGQILYHNQTYDPQTQPLINPLKQNHSSLKLTNNIIQFINQWIAPAQQAAHQSGIPFQVIIAQAALESGWGQKQIMTQDGQPSYNYFGIKADSAWHGKTTEITTTEYVNNQQIKTKHRFRVYDNHHQAVADYTRLLTQHPRYKIVSQATTAKAAAHALQQANYATDPYYADKLIQLIDQIDNIIKELHLPNIAGFKRLNFNN